MDLTQSPHSSTRPGTAAAAPTPPLPASRTEEDAEGTPFSPEAAAEASLLRRLRVCPGRPAKTAAPPGSAVREKLCLWAPPRRP